MDLQNKDRPKNEHVEWLCVLLQGNLFELRSKN